MFGAGLILFEGRVPDSRQSTFAPFFEDTARPEGSGPVQTVSCRSIFLDRFACILAPFETRCNLTPSLAVSTDREGVRLQRSEEHTSELQSRLHLVCRLLLEKK